jgi:hypothetical protein
LRLVRRRHHQANLRRLFVCRSEHDINPRNVLSQVVPVGRNIGRMQLKRSGAGEIVSISPAIRTRLPGSSDASPFTAPVGRQI